MGSEVVIVPVIFAVFAFVVWTIANNISRAKTARIVADLHGKVLEKCAGSQELIGYVQSDAGRRFLESAANGQANPAARILNAVQAGTILSLLGGAGTIVSRMHRDVEAQEILVTFGLLIMALGLGFLVSAGISYFLCKSWGLLNQAEVRI
jgi:ABC-type multidrug transport system fused ATPase/permease subunit